VVENPPLSPPHSYLVNFPTSFSHAVKMMLTSFFLEFTFPFKEAARDLFPFSPLANCASISSTLSTLRPWKQIKIPALPANFSMESGERISNRSSSSICAYSEKSFVLLQFPSPFSAGERSLTEASPGLSPPFSYQEGSRGGVFPPLFLSPILSPAR